VGALNIRQPKRKNLRVKIPINTKTKRGRKKRTRAFTVQGNQKTKGNPINTELELDPSLEKRSSSKSRALRGNPTVIQANIKGGIKEPVVWAGEAILMQAEEKIKSLYERAVDSVENRQESTRQEKNEEPKSPEIGNQVTPTNQNEWRKGERRVVKKA
jgi:hypothetical protein